MGDGGEEVITGIGDRGRVGDAGDGVMTGTGEVTGEQPTDAGDEWEPVLIVTEGRRILSLLLLL